MIEFDGVTKSYPDQTVAVDQLDLKIPDGQIMVLVGPSGCGKTTTLRMINRMVEPTSGTITIDETDVQTMSPPQLRRGIGYVIQHAGLFPHKTVADNIATVPRLVGATKDEARERAFELMELVGLDHSLAARYPVQLSGGQQQRVGVARALAADPPVLLMDEPFSAVDPIVREALQQQLLDLQQQLGKTIVFVTHDIDEAIRLGDQIAVFEVGGRISQLAAPDELLAAPANDFVRSFIGRDRGIRGLSFRGAGDLATQQEYDGWQVETDGDRRPIRLRRGDDHHDIDSSVAPDDSLRRALDLALLSPAGAAVTVDADGAYAGLLPASVVVEVADER